MRKLLLPLLYPLSLLYRLIIAIRNLFFDIGFFGQTGVDAKVISVGNLSVGGTGKTPLVLQLTDLLSSAEKKIAVVTRGYGRSSTSPKLYLPPEEMNDWRDSGDEPFLLKKRFRDLIISVDRNRVRGATYAIEKGKSELILLDDGFQHRSIKRDLDIVIVDGNKKLEERLLIPAGRLREPLKSLKRADIVVFMGSEDDSQGIRSCLKDDSVLCGGVKEPELLIRAESNEVVRFPELKSKKIAAFCGIGNPNGFQSILNSFDPLELELLKFPDHHIYTEKDLNKIKSSYISSNSDFLITTEKDALKLPSNFFAEVDVYQLRITFTISWSKDSFEKRIREIL